MLELLSQRFPATAKLDRQAQGQNNSGLMSGDPLPDSHTANPYRLPPWLWPVLFSALSWAVVFLTIPPSTQNFPLGDDWAFARGAIWFAHGQGIHYSNWASMPQLGQWLWAWPFLQILPWPHVALRLSVIVLSWLGLAAFCDLLQRERVPAGIAAFASCVLALNPLFFVSQGTFMTDVPALSFGLIALDFYARATAGKNLHWLFAATLAAVFAVITRQTMLLVPLAAALPILRNPELRRKLGWGLSILVPIAACFFVDRWFSHRADVLVMRPVLGMANLAVRSFVALHWCGLVVFPLCLLTARQINWKIFLAGFAIMVAGVVYLSNQPLPYGGKFPYCTGMLSLQGAFSDGLVVGERDILLTTPIRLALTILGCAGAAEILASLWGMIRAASFPSTLLLFTFLQFPIALTLPIMMDRYLEVLFPGALLLIATRRAPSAVAWPIGWSAVALSGIVSVALFHDWLAWNFARWQLGRRAVTTRNIDPIDIEGGFEWDGWYASADPAKPLHSFGPIAAAKDPASLTLPTSRDFFPDVAGHYALAFTAPPNTVVLDSLPYSRWLPPARKEFLFIQEKPQSK